MFLSRTQPLSNSCVSFPLFVCTHREGWVQPGRSGRGGILGALTRGSYHRGRGWEPARMGAPQSPGKLVEEQRLLQELHLAPGRALRRRPVLVEHSAAGGAGPPHPNPIEFLFSSPVNFCVINIFPFPFWIQNLIQGGGS